MILIAEATSTTILLLVAMAVASLVLLMRSNRHFRRRTVLEIPTAAVTVSAKRGSSTAEFDGWQVQMHELARDLSAQIDSKLTALDVLIRSAEEASERLERLLARARLERLHTDPQPDLRLHAGDVPVPDAFEASYFQK